ncbi:MAG: DUF5979 domain-containing protein, partial [Oscillospiraceae bacterium]|nr:DUF5979 domain-containing protein [Oscillospiraceae bacterium]
MTNRIHKNSRRGAFIAALCLVLTASLLLGGTRAWQLLTGKLNEFIGVSGAGELSVTKTVENADGSPLTDAQTQALFEFTVSLPGGGAYSYTIDGADMGEIHGGDRLYLSHGQTAVIKGLPAGTFYAVAETMPDGYTARSQNHRGHIRAGVTVNVAFVNAYHGAESGETGELHIGKTVLGGGADTNMPFDFTVVFDGYAPAVYLLDGAETPFPGDGRITLTHGQTAIFEKLPAGTGYAVTEDEASGYTADVREYAGTVPPGVTELPFTNRAAAGGGTGALEISKTVTGAGAEADRDFGFTVTFTGGGAPDKYLLGGAETPFADGDAIILRPGQAAVFENLPAGLRYAVTEGDYSAEGYTAVIGMIRGEIPEGETARAELRNHRDGKGDGAPLSVTKTVTGDGADLEKEFAFTVIVGGDTYSFKLKANEVWSLPDEIPAGTPYAVNEANYWDDGYALIGMANGYGVAAGEMIAVAATNAYRAPPPTAPPTQPTPPTTPPTAPPTTPPTAPPTTPPTAPPT